MTTPPACRRCRPARSRATTSSSPRTCRRSRATPTSSCSTARRSTSVGSRSTTPSRRWTSSRCGRRSRMRSTARRSSTPSTEAAAVVATQFMPQEIAGYAEDVQTYEYDPDQGTAAAPAGRPDAAGRDRVLVPDGRQPRLHARSEAELRGDGGRPQRRRLQGHASHGSVAPGLRRTGSTAAPPGT